MSEIVKDSALAENTRDLEATGEDVVRAERALEAAARQFRTAFALHLSARRKFYLHLYDTPERGFAEWKAFLTETALSNRAQWSGGAWSVTNVLEATRREMALEALNGTRWGVKG